MSLLEPLKKLGVNLPPAETEDGLTAKIIMDKIRSFYMRLEKADGEITEYAPGFFLELLYNYPKSMTSFHLTESLKLLIALIYFQSKPDEDEPKPLWDGFSYEDLSLIFDCSKATVHEAIRQKESQAKEILEEAKLRTKAKKLAIEKLVEEEKLKLLNDLPKELKETSKQTHIPIREWDNALNQN